MTGGVKGYGGLIVAPLLAVAATWPLWTIRGHSLGGWPVAVTWWALIAAGIIIRRVSKDISKDKDSR